MKKHKLLPLTETMHYILLALREPLHGYAIMQKIEVMSEGQVRIAAGTLYGAIENLLKYNWIVLVASEEPRRKVYRITDEGLHILQIEKERLHHILSLYEGVEHHE
ncbi:PadR family transcriptional regulator [Lysinibacillus piscis]|uniref:Transcriptional regulator n=1 Tax=Lysinibacillus piscis TaxID=2518931 RepID=A0ABQ5NKP4_9BACI|nr:PadR family transcriptional regulator [Lysinibacillus sp. KH24]GLC88859.1 transcriptional regulator [Lysinibacillus sp. KH24]